MYTLYNLLLYLCFPIILFYLFCRFRGGFVSHFSTGINERLGFFSDDIKQKLSEFPRWIWIHTASVGEVKIAKLVIQLLKKNFLDYRILLSTITSSGNELAKNENLADLIIYLPIDFNWSLKRLLSLFRANVLILVETELWPNFIRQTKRLGTRIILVNGRISNNSYFWYRFFYPFICKILANIDIFAMREKTDAERIISLGARIDGVKVTGDMKYDFITYHPSPITNYQEFGFQPNDLIWVCGSTRKGEEKIILEVYLEVLKKYPNLKLILAPRHLERIAEIENLLKQKNISFLRKSQLPITNYQLPVSCLLWDSYGELMNAYALATIIFVGGSLVPKGGHNILEPACLSKPVIFGPYMESFQESANLLLSSSGGIQVNNGEELKYQVLRLLANPEEAKKIGNNAYLTMQKKKDVVKKTVDLISTLL